MCGIILLSVLVQATECFSLEVEWGLGKNAAALDKSYENLNWGFRGTAWGTDKNIVQQRYLLDDCQEIAQETQNCNVRDANLSLGDVPLMHVRYMFHKEKFYGVSLKYETAHYKEVLHMAANLLGDPTGERDDFPIWDLPQIEVWISNSHFSVKDKAVLGFAQQDGGGTF